MKWSILFLVALASQAYGFDDTDLDGIAYVQMTVEDIDLSIRFYTEVLDGMLIPEFRLRGYQDDDTYQQMFQKEILDAEEQGVDPETIGVPNIQVGGNYVVNWDFILFDNSLVWLIQFTDQLGNLFRRFDPNVGSAKTGYGHVALWASECSNQFQLLEAVYDGERNIGSPTAGLTTTVEHQSFAERNAVVQDDITITLPVEGGGFRFGATRGPNGEKVEFSFRRGVGVAGLYEGFCNVGAVHSAMLPQCTKLTSRYSPSIVKTNGFHHVSLTIRDTTEAVDYYTTIIGGKQPDITPGLQWPEMFRNLVVQDDYLSAFEANLPLDANFGFVEVGLGREGAGTMDMTFINFDNYFLETYAFDPANPDDKALLDRFWSSPAYLNTVSPGFWVKSSVSLPSYIQRVEEMADAKGMHSAKANRAKKVKSFGEKVAAKNYTSPFLTGDLEGFDFTFAKGPSGEQISFAQFNGRSSVILERKYKIYGGVSVAYGDVNPYEWGGYDDVCSSSSKK